MTDAYILSRLAGLLVATALVAIPTGDWHMAAGLIAAAFLTGVVAARLRQ